MTDKFAAQKRYIEAQKEDGFKRVTLWVPAADVKRVLAYGAKLRKAYNK